jgi:hypothetical protein
MLERSQPGLLDDLLRAAEIADQPHHGREHTPGRAAREIAKRCPAAERLRAVGRFDHEEATHHLLGLGEGAVGHVDLAVACAHPHGLGHRLQRIAALELALLAELGGEAPHLGHRRPSLGGRGPLAFRIVQDQEHVARHEDPPCSTRRAGHRHFDRKLVR